MKQSLGIDIVDLARIDRLFRKYGMRFVERVLSGDERELLDSRPDPVSFIAGRFAAKEAAIKALGSYLSDRPAMKKLSIQNQTGGQPRLEFKGTLADELAGIDALVSISHERKQAVAVVLLTGEK